MYKHKIKQSSNVTVVKDKDNLYEDEIKNLKNIIEAKESDIKRLKEKVSEKNGLLKQ